MFKKVLRKLTVELRSFQAVLSGGSTVLPSVVSNIHQMILPPLRGGGCRSNDPSTAQGREDVGQTILPPLTGGRMSVKRSFHRSREDIGQTILPPLTGGRMSIKRPFHRSGEDGRMSVKRSFHLSEDDVGQTILPPLKGGCRLNDPSTAQGRMSVKRSSHRSEDDVVKPKTGATYLVGNLERANNSQMRTGVRHIEGEHAKARGYRWRSGAASSVTGTRSKMFHCQRLCPLTPSIRLLSLTTELHGHATHWLWPLCTLSQEETK
ncbi:hypothetical protein J6590_061400 [Homalodisca vitripennis]|nr:hypothetical protein J6590_061400 [Homalodisca vitripennis]